MKGTRHDPIVIYDDDDYSRTSTPAIELPWHGPMQTQPVTDGLRWNSAFRGGVPVTNQLDTLSQQGEESPAWLHIHLQLSGSEATCLIFLFCLARLIADFLDGGL
jgi:hypothetical protein